MLDPNIPEHITTSSGPSGKVFMSIRKFDVQLPIRQEHMGGKLPSFVFAIAVGRGQAVVIVECSTALKYPLVHVLNASCQFSVE